MNSRIVVAVLVAVAVVIVGFVLFALSGGPGVEETKKETTTVAVGTVDAAAPKKKAKKPEPQVKWERLGQGTVVGVVREYGSEKPIEGVEVTLEAGLPGPNELLRAKTGADGGFAFDKVTNFDAWTLKVKAPAPLADTELAGVVVVENRQTSLGSVYLAPAFTVPGTVVDEKDAPVAGAVVRALRSRSGASSFDVLRLIRELPARPVAVDVATSGPDGKFEFHKVPPGRFDFTVEKPGYQIKVEDAAIVTPDAKNHPFRFVLLHGFQVEGKVVREGGGPVGGISVVAFHEPNNDVDLRALDKSFATTDEKGAFTIDELGAGRYILAVTPEGEPAAIATNVDVPTKKPVEVVLKGDAWLEGKVTGDGEKAIPDAQVYAMNFDGKSPTVGNTKTDADGHYVIRGLKSGPLQLFLVQAEGYGNYPDDLMALMRGRGKSDVTLVAGKNEKNVTLAKGGVVRGIVKEKDGDAPIAGARVELGTMLAMFGGIHEVTTGPDGRFEITSVPKGVAVLMVSKEGWFQPGVNMQSAMMTMGARMQGGGGTQKDTGKGATIVVSDPGEVIERTLELSRGSTISGVVTSPDGQAVAGAQVSLVAEDSGNGMGRMLAGLFPSPEPRLTDAQGRFEIPGPAPGDKARAVARATGWLDGKSAVVSCGAGETKTGIDVKLRQGATISGRVHDETGKAIEGALVRWVSADDPNDWSIQWKLRSATPSVTDAKGEFRIPNVETGKLVVQAEDSRHLPWMKKDASAEDGKTLEVDATLKMGLVIEGRVLDLDGRPRTDADVSWNRVAAADAPRDPFQDGSGDAKCDANGTFRIEGLAPGSYDLVATASGVAPSDSQRVDAGGPPTTLQLTQAFAISGLVRAKGGEPLGNVQVDLMKAVDPSNGGAMGVAKAGGGFTSRTTSVKSTRSNADGTFEFKEVPGGTYDLRTSVPNWDQSAKPNIVPTTVKNVAAGTQNVLIEADAGLTISGTAYGEDGQPVAAGYVWAQPVDKNGGDMASSQIEAGKFELVGLPPGKYRVNVSGAGMQQKSVVFEAGAKDVRIDFGGGGSVRVHVTSEGGVAASGARVWAQGDAGSAQGVTDADGRCELKSLGEGTYTVQANMRSGDSYVFGKQEGVQVRAGGPTDVDVQLAKPQAPPTPQK